MKNFTRMAMVLFIICAAAAGALGFVNQITKPRIAEQAELEREQALKEVFPDAGGFSEVVPGRLWDALRGGEKAGSVILTETQGYSGTIRIVLGVSPEGSITGIKILNQSETPGLGAKIVEKPFLGQFIGKTEDEASLRKDDPARGGIDAISAATISSRAVAGAVRGALESYRKGELK